MKENTNRNKFNFEIYKNKIDMNKFIEEKWKEKLLFAQWNHPLGDYFFELVKNLFIYFEEELDHIKLKNITYPTRRYSFFDEKTVLFFRKYLPKVNLS